MPRDDSASRRAKLPLRPLKAILTTYQATLELDIDVSRNSVVARTIDTGKGIYFGLTRTGRQFLVAARNLDIHRNVRNPAIGTNVIYRLDERRQRLTPLIDDPLLHDLHQIRAWGRSLFVILGRGSTLAIFDIPTARLIRTFDLDRFVPKELPRHAPVNGDVFHFNSVSFTASSLLILAHNWDRPSFALEFALPRVGSRGKLRLAAVHHDLGLMSHDIVLDGGVLFALDGDGGRLLARRPGIDERTVSLGSAGNKTFPRGLSLTRKYVLVTCGTFANDRPDRETGDTRLVILDRQSLETVMDVIVGPHGNPAAILCVSEQDRSDRRPRFWLTQPKKAGRRKPR
jgi:hypothetical protein